MIETKIQNSLTLLVSLKKIIETKIQNILKNIVQIIIRTRGLGCALGRAIGKTLWRREASDDDAQRRRSTASACRQ